MSKIDNNDLILFQRGELGEERKKLIENELRSDLKLQQELEVLIRADTAMENHFTNFQMPKDFQKEVKKKFKKEFNFSSFLNPKFILSYSSGIATACFMFVFIYTLDPFLQLQGQRNNDIVVRGGINKNLNKTTLPQEWIVNENLNFQMIKFKSLNEQGLFVKNNESLLEGDKVLLRLIPLKDLKVSFGIKNRENSSTIKNNFFLEKGKEISLPKAISPTENFFEVKGPSGKETFFIKDKNNQIIFDFTYFIN